jgi:hypothetical protein
MPSRAIHGRLPSPGAPWPERHAMITLTDSCGFPASAFSALAVKAEDYPLSLPLHLLTPRRRLPLMAREFLEFLTLPQPPSCDRRTGLC